MLSILSIACVQVHAAALDRAGQPISAFLENGNYAEASISVLDGNISGKARPQYMLPNTDPSTSDMVDHSIYYNVGLKLQLNPYFSFGLIYDQPYGVDAKYQNKENGTFSALNEVTSAEVNSQNLAFLFGYQPNKNWNFYAAPIYQTIKGNVELNGRAFEVVSGYKMNIKENSDLGWLAGFAYQIPEIALKAAVTYRSEIKHTVTATESFEQPLSSIVPLIGIGTTEITTPQSVNLDLQTGVTPTTLAFLNARWVNWKDFAIQPYQFGKVTEFANASQFNYPRGLNLVDYHNDQISLDLGLAKKVNDLWSGVVSAGWDSGAGNPTSLLGPIDGYWSAGIGFQFNPTPNYFLQGGVKYFWLGDAIGHSATYAIPDNAENAKVADYRDNTALAYQLKIGYKF